MCNYIPKGEQPDDTYLMYQIQRSPEEAAAILADECRKKDMANAKLQGNIEELRKQMDSLGETLAAYIEENAKLREEVRGMRAFKNSVDQALNSGDGTYRP